MSETPPGESPPDGTEPHRNNSEFILISENNIPYDLDHQEYEQWCNEEEVGERDQNGFPGDEFIPESLDSINSDFSLNEVLERYTDSINSDVASDEIDLGNPFDGISEDNVSPDFHFNDGTSEPIDSILSEENLYFNSTADISNTSINSQQTINPFFASTSPVLPGEEVIPEEEREDTWAIGHNPVSWDDLCNDEMSHIYASLPHSPEENHNTTMSNLNTGIEAEAIEVIADSNSFGDALPGSGDIPLEDLIRDLGLIPPQVTMPCKRECVPTTIGREPSVVTSMAITSQQSKKNNKSAIDLGIELPKPFQHCHQLDLSDTGLDRALPGASSQSTRLGLSDTDLDAALLPGASSQSTQLHLSDTGLQQTLLSGTLTSSLRLDLPSIGVANQVGMAAMDVAVATVVFPLHGHASNLITWNNAGVVNDQAMEFPSLPSLEEKKRKRRESMKAASKRHRVKKKEKEDALIDKVEQLLKENSELRDQRKRLSDEKEFYLRELKRRKEMHDSSKE
ncbi:uncharacterized protein LOC110249413 isoform X1 [Exaiptasia diaphana]|uniref:BZIP domain-containing protein n=1 Tax=Exaiptasia diaphana TaxID=2652724 RepID=A0A913XZC3_EXADI|nr:uncharacterized protein LOC110249413 isoform X1 [Exaiptasia diaphana]